MQANDEAPGEDAMIEAPEAPHHHHHKTGLPWFDFIVPVAVLCISVASLLTSLQSEKSMHALVDQNKRLVEAQSTPLLMLDSGNLKDGKPIITLTLSNVGTGPAQIAWLHMRDDQGQEFSSQILHQRLSALDHGLSFISEIITSSFLRSGDSRIVLEVPKPKPDSPALGEWVKLNDARFHLHATACYCSMFDECRVTEFGESHPKVVASCDEAGK